VKHIIKSRAALAAIDRGVIRLETLGAATALVLGLALLARFLG